MPLAAKNNLDELYYLTRVLDEHRVRLESERDQLKGSGSDAAHLYVIEVEITALSEEAAKLGSSISDILERDLQR